MDHFSGLLETADKNRNFILKKLESVEIFQMDSELFQHLIEHLRYFVHTTMDEGVMNARTTHRSAKCEFEVWYNYVGRIEDWRNETNANLTDLWQPDMAKIHRNIVKLNVRSNFQLPRPVIFRRIEDGRYIYIAGIPIPVGKYTLPPAGKARKP